MFGLGNGIKARVGVHQLMYKIDLRSIHIDDNSVEHLSSLITTNYKIRYFNIEKNLLTADKLTVVINNLNEHYCITALLLGQAEKVDLTHSLALYKLLKNNKCIQKLNLANINLSRSIRSEENFSSSLMEHLCINNISEPIIRHKKHISEFYRV